MNLLNIGTNKKLGPHVASWSRTVGATCPRDCPFLTGETSDGEIIPPKHRCYAKKIENRYVNVEANWARAVDVDFESWTDKMEVEIVKACTRKKNPVKAIRIHVGGDFGSPNYSEIIDGDYYFALITLLKRIRERGLSVRFWLYSHMWESMTTARATLQDLGVECFASVHTHREMIKAKNLGWRLAIDPGETLPSKTYEWSFPIRGEDGVDLTATTKALGCPEQVGTKKDCGTCGFCFHPAKGVQDVVFFRHS